MKKYRVKGVIHSRYTAAGNKIRKKKRMGRAGKLALLISVTVLISVIFAIIIGNLLNMKSGDADAYLSKVDPIEVGGRLDLGKSTPIKGHSLTIGESPDFDDGEYSAVTFFVTDESGLLYSSAVAEHFGRQSASDVDLPTYVSLLESEGYRTVACFLSSFMSIDNVSVSSAEALYEQGLIAEVVSAGADEVLVFFDGADGDDLHKMREFLREVKVKCPEISLGVRMTIADAKDESVWPQISKFSSVCDYVALDLGSLEISNEGGADANFVASIRFYLRNYNVRILFDGANQSALSFVDNMKIANWSIMGAEKK